MKSIFCSMVFLLFFICIHAQESNPFTTGFEASIPSKILGQKRTVWIHIPNSNGGNAVKEKSHYPVIYLLDGSDNFNTVVSITEHMAESSLSPPMIVVGIIHSDRVSELTTGRDKDLPNVIGAGEKFMSFVEKELIPYIDANYPTTTYKTLIGHSLGGLTVLNTFLHSPKLFNAYVSLDGSLWWNNQKILKDARANLPGQNYKGTSLFMGMANRLELGVDTVSVLKDTTEATELIRSNLAFIKELSKYKGKGLHFKYKYYEDDNHPSMRLIGEYDALRFIFDFYKLRIYDSQLENPHFPIDSLLIAHYKDVSEKMGYVTKPAESQVNNLGYAMMAAKQFTKAETLFKLNVENNPESGNCYDSLGDMYLASGDKSNAIESLKKL